MFEAHVTGLILSTHRQKYTNTHTLDTRNTPWIFIEYDALIYLSTCRTQDH